MSLSSVKAALDELNQAMNELEFAMNTQVQVGGSVAAPQVEQTDLFGAPIIKTGPSIDTAQLAKRLDQAIDRVEQLLKDAA